jgi:hypothetical protein
LRDLRICGKYEFLRERSAMPRRAMLPPLSLVTDCQRHDHRQSISGLVGGHKLLHYSHWNLTKSQVDNEKKARVPAGFQDGILPVKDRIQYNGVPAA